MSAMRNADRIGGLEELLKEAGARRLPPVESWNPSCCGDIGMRIRGDGVWLYQDSPIGRTSLVKLFASVLRRDADGRTYLVTPAEKVIVAVDDAPFMAVEMEIEGNGKDQTLIFRTNVDDIVRCGHDHPLRFSRQDPSGGLKPYILIRGRLEALLTRALYLDLVDAAVTERRNGREMLGVWSAGEFFELTHGLNLAA